MNTTPHSDGIRSGTVTLVGGPTALIEIGGFRLLTDPTFDPPGPHSVGTRILVKTTGPAIPAEQIGPVDAVLLSHDQHPDNLDTLGRQFLTPAPVVFTTVEAAERLGEQSRSLRNWQSTDLHNAHGTTLRITGVPASHGPENTSDLTGTVTGFVLSGERLPTVYISGDNSSLSIVGDVADHLGPIDVAILFAGAGRTSLMNAYLTLTNDQVARAARILGARIVIPIHNEGWDHLTEGPDGLIAAFEAHGAKDALVLPTRGTALPFALGEISPDRHPQPAAQTP